MEAPPIKLPLDAIRVDGGTQSRCHLDNRVIEEYARDLANEEPFPAVVVFSDGKDHWLADGFHRYHAHQAACLSVVLAEIHLGTQRGALLYSLGANAKHGLRRTNADKKNAVQTMLSDLEWGRWSDSKVAQACGVHHSTVAHHRFSLAESASEKPSEDRTYTTRHGTEAVMNTAAIGRKTSKVIDPEPSSLVAVSG